MPRRRRGRPGGADGWGTYEQEVRAYAGLPEGTQIVPSTHPIVLLAKLSYALESRTWLLWFLLFIAAAWSLVYDPKLLNSFMPNIPSLFSGSAAVIPALPPVKLPKTRLGAWELGHLAGQADALLHGQGTWEAAAGGEATTQLEAIRAQVAALLEVPVDSLTPAGLQALGQLIAQQEKPNIVVTRVKGLFKLANVMWLVGILGVAVSLGPALLVLFGPLIRLLAHWARMAMITGQLLIKPFLWPILLYGCAGILAAAQHQPEPAASRIALGGVVLAVGVLFWALQKHVDPLRDAPIDWSNVPAAPPRPKRFLDVVDPTLLLNGFAAACCVPLAHVHSSQLLGFFSAMALFGALGFVVVPTGCGWLVGWWSKDTMLVTALSATCLVLGLIVSRILDPQRQWIAPFQLGLSIFGTMTLLLAGLICCSHYYYYGTDKLVLHWVANGLYALLLAGLTVAGAMTGMESMFSVGTTFIALWLSEKGLELMLVSGLGWVAILLGSLGLCGGAYFIHTHPAWIATMLSL